MNIMIAPSHHQIDLDNHPQSNRNLSQNGLEYILFKFQNSLVDSTFMLHWHQINPIQIFFPNCSTLNPGPLTFKANHHVTKPFATSLIKLILCNKYEAWACRICLSLFSRVNLFISMSSYFFVKKSLFTKLMSSISDFSVNYDRIRLKAIANSVANE